MAFVREFEGEWRVCIAKRGKSNTKDLLASHIKKDYIVKYNYIKDNIQRIGVHISDTSIQCPKELLGKRVKIIVKPLDD